MAHWEERALPVLAAALQPPELIFLGSGPEVKRRGQEGLERKRWV
jgi:hypothetical protein